MSDTTTIPVSGMHCAACSARVQQKLEDTPGVGSANVNLMTGTATVDYDPRTVSPDRLVAAIRETGYGAELPSSAGSDEDAIGDQDEARAAEIADLTRKFAGSLVTAIVAMLASMLLAEQTPGAMADPLMRLMMPLTDAIRSVAPWVDRVSSTAWRYL